MANCAGCGTYYTDDNDAQWYCPHCRNGTNPNR